MVPHSSVGKESACNAGDPGSIPGSGRSPGEGIGYPLQYSWVSPVAQLVKKLPTIRETWVRSLGWGDTLEKGKATHSSILAWRIPGTIQCMGSQRVGHDWATFTSLDHGGHSEDGEQLKDLRAYVGGRTAKTNWKYEGIERVHKSLENFWVESAGQFSHSTSLANSEWTPPNNSPSPPPTHSHPLEYLSAFLLQYKFSELKRRFCFAGWQAIVIGLGILKAHFALMK